MSEIKYIDPSRLRQEESFSYHQMAAAEMSKCVDPKFAPVYQAYTGKLKTFDEALKKSGGENVLSKPIHEQDAVCDRLYRGLSQQVAALEDAYYDPAIAEVARQARIILKKYGNPMALPYLEENGVLQNLVQELEAFDGTLDSESPDEIAADEIRTNRLSAIHIDGWVARLKVETTRFRELFTERNTQNAALETGATKAARLATDDAYRAAVKRINALAEVNGEADYLEIINALNTLIERQQAIIKARATKSANARKKAEEEEAAGSPETTPAP